MEGYLAQLEQAQDWPGKTAVISALLAWPGFQQLEPHQQEKLLLAYWKPLKSILQKPFWKGYRELSRSPHFMGFQQRSPMRVFWKTNRERSSSPYFAGFQREPPSTVVYLADLQGTLHAIEYTHQNARLIPIEVALLEGQRQAQGELILHSSPNMRLFQIWPNSPDLSRGELALCFGKERIPLTPVEVDHVLSGNPLPPTHRLSMAIRAEPVNLVHQLDAFSMKNGSHQQLADKLVHGLVRAYPEATFAQTRLSARTSRNLLEVQRFKATDPSTIAAVAPDESFKVIDGNVIRNLHDELSPVMKVRVFRPGTSTFAEGPQAPELVFVMGHQSPELDHLITKLGKAGAFKDAQVVLVSCGSSRTCTLTHQINGLHGARATLRFYVDITAAQAEAAMADFSVALAQWRHQVPADQLLSQALKRHGLHATWVISRRLNAVIPQEQAHG